MSQKITPCLWFEKDAEQLSTFYTSIFKDSEVKNTTRFHNTPSGTVEVVSVRLRDLEFTFLVAGPLFKFNPSISLVVACPTKDEVEALWAKLAQGGKPLMELGEYPFSEKFGWTEDKYGLSWQVMFVGGRAIEQSISPSLLFVGKQCGKAEEAFEFYSTVFNKARLDSIVRYGQGEQPDKEGTVKHAVFTLEGQKFVAMDSALDHRFAFNEAISFMVHCETQEEIDYYWGKLSADSGAEECGWLKDKYGLSWQIVPSVMDEMFKDKDEKKLARVTAAILKTKKFDIEALNRAYFGE